MSALFNFSFRGVFGPSYNWNRPRVAAERIASSSKRRGTRLSSRKARNSGEFEEGGRWRSTSAPSPMLVALVVPERRHSYGRRRLVIQQDTVFFGSESTFLIANLEHTGSITPHRLLLLFFYLRGRRKNLSFLSAISFTSHCLVDS